MARLIGSCLALVCVLIPAGRTFAAETGMLYVKSDPPGATVVIAGEERGKTPVLIKGLAPGEFTILLRIAGAKPVTRQATVEARKVTTVDVAMEVPSATLTIISEPLEATVFLDQRDVGKTPITLEKLAAGAHHLLLLKRGHPRTVRDVVLQPGAEVTIDVKLGTAQDAKAEPPPPVRKKVPTPVAPRETPAAKAFDLLIGALRSPGKVADKAKACREHLTKSPEGAHKAEVEALSKVFSARSEDKTISAWADYAGAFPGGRLREEAIAALRRSGDALRVQMKLALAADDEGRTVKLGRAYLAALPQNASAGEIRSLLNILKTPRGATRSGLVKKHIRAYPQGTFTGTFEGSMVAWSAKEEGDAFERLRERFAATAPESDLLRGADLFLKDHGSGPRASEVRAVRPVLALKSLRARLAAARKYIESYPGGAFVDVVRGLESDLARRKENDLYRVTMASVSKRETYAGRLLATETYLSEYPQGEHAATIRNAADRIRALIAEEEQAFGEFSKSLEKIASTQEGLRLCAEFLGKYPDGPHVSGAISKREALRGRLKVEVETSDFEALMKGLASGSLGRIAKARECLRFLKRYRRGKHARQVGAKLKGFASDDLSPHAGRVRAAAFSPDSKLLATADADTGLVDSGVWLWQLPEGKLVQKYQSRPAFSCSSAAFSPGERPELWLGEASGCLSGWDLSRGEIAWRYRLGSAPVTSISAHGKSEASTVVLGDRKVHVWESADWSLRTGIPCPGGASAAATNPAGSMVTVGGRDGWLAAFGTDGEPAWTEFDAHRGEVNSVAYSPNGLYVASCSGDDNTVAVWNATTGARVWKVEDASANVAFATDSAVLTGAGLRAVEDGRLVAKLGGGGPVAASPDGVFAFTSDAGGRSKLWYLPALLWR
jgi:hypothetical protein